MGSPWVGTAGGLGGGVVARRSTSGSPRPTCVFHQGMGRASTAGAPEGRTTARSRGSAASSATVRIGVGVSCQLVLWLVPVWVRWWLGLATTRLYSPISFSRFERKSGSPTPPP